METFLRAEAAGAMDFDEATELLRLAVAEACEQSRSRLLLDARDCRAEPRSGCIWHLVADLAAHAGSRLLRIAVLVRPDQIEHARFFALAAYNRGLHAEGFCHYADAIEWLMREALAVRHLPH